MERAAVPFRLGYLADECTRLYQRRQPSQLEKIPDSHWLRLSPQGTQVTWDINAEYRIHCRTYGVILGVGAVLTFDYIRDGIRHATVDRKAAHRKLDRRCDDLCGGGLRKRARWITNSPVDEIDPGQAFLRVNILRWRKSSG